MPSLRVASRGHQFIAARPRLYQRRRPYQSAARAVAKRTGVDVRSPNAPPERSTGGCPYHDLVNHMRINDRRVKANSRHLLAGDALVPYPSPSLPLLSTLIIGWRRSGSTVTERRCLRFVPTLG